MKAIRLLTALLLAMTLGACDADLRELCYDHNHFGDLNVLFDWPHAPALNAKGMTVLFFRDTQTSGEPERYDFSGNLGGKARLGTGSYRALAYNNDTETILYRYDDEDYGGAATIEALEAYTRRSSIEEGTQLSRSGMPRAPETEDEPVILEPDPLCGAGYDLFSLGIGEAKAITMTPHMRTREVTITIHNVPNLKYSSQFGGALSGLAASKKMLSGIPGEYCATQAFTGYVVGDSTVMMHFRTFGHCPKAAQGEQNTHILTVYAILADGTKWYYTVDVTNQMHNTPTPADPDDDDLEITIELDGLPLPKPIVNGSGFQPTVDGWQSVEIQVGM